MEHEGDNLMLSNEKYQRIWQVIQLIPEGKVASYGQVADLAGLPGRARLAGKSLSHVPREGYQGKPVPWFRVLRSSGHIAFPIESESFQEQRAKLISEGVSVNGSRVSLKKFQWQPELMDILFALEN